MKITIYELLGMVKDGKAPKRIKYKGHIYQYQYEDTKEVNIINYYYSEEVHCHLIDGGYHDIRLNDEVEILEEKKILEKIPLNYADDKKPEEVYEYLRCSHNQIIDYINSKGDE